MQPGEELRLIDNEVIPTALRDKYASSRYRGILPTGSRIELFEIWDLESNEKRPTVSAKNRRIDETKQLWAFYPNKSL